MSTKKQRLYEAATLLFNEKGYHAASMRDLAERLQLKVSSLYSHIGSKEEILQKICFDYARQFLSEIEQVEQTLADSPAQIRAIIRLHVRTALSNTRAFMVFNDEWRHLSEPHLSDFLRLRKEYEHRLQHIIESGIERGELKNLNAKVVLYTLLASLRWLPYWYKPERKIQPAELEAQLETLVLQGIEKKTD